MHLGDENGIQHLDGNPERKITVPRTRRKWEGNKINFKYIRCEGIDWIHLDQDFIVGGSTEHYNDSSSFITGGQLFD
jgi:hypothetical protein